MLAARFPGILPQMTEAEALESAAMQSLGGMFDVSRWKTRPYRSPHHTASAVAMVGGGSNPRPGEISIAMHGILFLDELPEFDRHVLEVLREPLESGRITISRAARRADFRAQFQLVAAMNPCPCGYLGHYNGKCRCTPDQIARYRGKISGPLLDRIDIQIEVPAVPQETLLKQADGETNSDIQARVNVARQHALTRQNKPNAQLTVSEIDALCAPDAQGAALLQQAISRLNLSARAYHRVLKVARTIADLAGDEDILSPHIAEAVQYRRMGRQG
jgi:magnesium chelatase family protein